MHIISLDNAQDTFITAQKQRNGFTYVSVWQPWVVQYVSFVLVCDGEQCSYGENVQK